MQELEVLDINAHIYIETMCKYKDIWEIRATKRAPFCNRFDHEDYDEPDQHHPVKVEIRQDGRANRPQEAESAYGDDPDNKWNQRVAKRGEREEKRHQNASESNDKQLDADS